uniref:Uncharacterized protein n=1 Tax=Parastrongyloides trichosuri TaxID=131310 RepID=A0A0N5A2C6_PARTI
MFSFLLLNLFIQLSFQQDKFLWDGKDNKLTYTLQVESLNGTKFPDAEIFAVHNEYVQHEFSQLNWKIRNAKKLVIKIDNITEDIGGLVLSQKGTTYIQSIGGRKDDKWHIIQKDKPSCNIYGCEVGFVFADKKMKGEDYSKNGIKDTDLIFYYELSTNSKVYTFGKIEFEKEVYPLVICPGENWLNVYGGSEYLVNGTKGYSYKSFNKKHYLVPLYPFPSYAETFKCGMIKYVQGNILYIGYQYKKKRKGTNSLSDVHVDITKDKLVCSNDDKEEDYIIFIHHPGAGKDKEMVRVEPGSKIKLYLDQIVYLYNKKNTILKRIEENGVNYITTTTNGEKLQTTAISPSCRVIIDPPRGSLQLFYRGEIVNFPNNTKKGSNKVFYVGQEYFNKPLNFKCKIIFDKRSEVANNKNLSGFYMNKFFGVFIQMDRHKNRKEMESIKFDDTLEDFGKYKCLLKSTNDKLHNSQSLIERLGVIFIPDKSIKIVKDVKWDNYQSIAAGCDGVISNYAQIQDVVVNFDGGHAIYTYSKDHDMFAKSDKSLIVNISKLPDKNFNVKNVYITCIYIVGDVNATFYLYKNGAVEESKNNDPNYGFSFERQKIYLILIILLVGVIVIASMVLILYEKKRKRARRISKGESSGLSSTSSSESETKGTSETEKVEKVEKVEKIVKVGKIEKPKDMTPESISAIIKHEKRAHKSQETNW